MKRIQRWVIVWTLSLLLIGPVFSVPVFAANERHVTLVLIPGLTWDHISPVRTPNLFQMISQGGAANMTLPFAGNNLSGYYAIGAGSRGIALKEGAKAFQTDEKVMLAKESTTLTGGQLFERQTGEKPEGTIVLPDMQKIQNSNQTNRYTTTPGGLGSAIREMGGRVAVIGSSDLGTDIYRPAAIIAADRSGQIGQGDISPFLIRKDPNYLYGIRTDWDKLLQTYVSLQDRTNLLVVETGDLTRLAAKRRDLSNLQVKILYNKLLAETDRLIGHLLQQTDSDHLLIAASPLTFSDIGIGTKHASVLLMTGGGIEPGSLLESTTTKQLGLVTVYDLPSTILSFLGVSGQIKGGLGQTIGTQSIKIPANVYLSQQIEKLSLLNRYRPIFVKGYAELMLGLLLVKLVVQLMQVKKTGWLDQPLVALLLFPAVFLLVPVGGAPTSTPVWLLKMGLLTVVSLTGLAFYKTIASRLLVISGVTIGLLIIDMGQQGRWMKDSVLGFDVLGGARYYGIGNEYMGVLIGAALLFFWLLKTSTKFTTQFVRWFGVTLFASIVFLLAAPKFGTNAGGALAAVIAFTYALLADFKQIQYTKKWAWVGIGFLAVLFGMMILHSLASTQGETHVSKSVQLIRDGQYLEIGKIMLRKLSLNWKLLHVSVWGKLFWVVFLIITLDVVAIRFKQIGQRILFGSLFSVNFLVAGVVILFLNDSGVLAAAACLLYPTVTVLTQMAKNERFAVNELVLDDLTEDGSTS